MMSINGQGAELSPGWCCPRAGVGSHLCQCQVCNTSLPICQQSCTPLLYLTHLVSIQLPDVTTVVISKLLPSIVHWSKAAPQRYKAKMLSGLPWILGISCQTVLPSCCSELRVHFALLALECTFVAKRANSIKQKKTTEQEEEKAHPQGR